MTFDEDKIRQSLRHNLERMEVPRDVPPATMRRGRARRVTWMASVASLILVALVGGIAGAVTLLEGDGSIDPAPGPDTSTSFARYFFEAGSREASASGVLEVNSQEGTLCYRATTENIRASHLLRNTGVVAGGRRFERMIVVTFFDPDDRDQRALLSSGARMCFQEEQLAELEGDLQVLIDHPEDFRVDFHRRPNDDPGLVAELRESPDRTVPDVEHQELRSAYRELQQAGFEVRFSAELDRFNYPKYVRDRSRIVHPEPWVADVDPEPGEPAPDGFVTITATECPEGAPFCD